MITNEVQYRATKAHLDRFDEAAANIESRPGKRTKLKQLELDAVRSQVDDFRVELADFDRLRGGALLTFDAASLEELSTVLVKARTARGWTQRQFAEKLGVAEQQIQRYEANDYRSTSLARLCDIANALGVVVAQHAELTTSPDRWQTSRSSRNWRGVASASRSLTTADKTLIDSTSFGGCASIDGFTPRQPHVRAVLRASQYAVTVLATVSDGNAPRRARQARSTPTDLGPSKMTLP